MACSARPFYFLVPVHAMLRLVHFGDGGGNIILSSPTDGVFGVGFVACAAGTVIPVDCLVVVLDP